MIRLVLLPLAYAAYRAIRVLRTPWCDLLDHALELVDGELRCTRCPYVYTLSSN